MTGAMSGRSDGAVALGGVALEDVLTALRRREAGARACYVYDLDALRQRARRFQRAFEPLHPLTAYALKANALPALIEPLAAIGLGADAASLGELEIARAAGFDAAHRVLNGNGKTPEEIDWAARAGVFAVNADHIEELDLLQDAAARHGRTVRVALRVNPGIEAPVHPYVATGGDDAKFGVAAGEALEAWAVAEQWPDLCLDGLHLHVGSQILETAAVESALDTALDLRAEAARRGATLRLLNLGGGFGVDYKTGTDFPLERFAQRAVERLSGAGLDLVLEPGRWLVAPVGVLVSEVLWVKRRDGQRFVVLAAGMNDLIRPALYQARHRIEPVGRRPGPSEPAVVVGPVCESADVFATDAELPPLERGDLVAILDTGAYGASMASNYNGRGRLAEIVVSEGRMIRARASEGPGDLARRTEDVLEA